MFDVCPPALQASYPTDLNSPTAVVSWTPPNATDNTGGPVTEDASHSPGDAFSIGVTTVKIDAIDESGNSASCEFNITVVGRSSKSGVILFSFVGAGSPLY